MQIDISFEPADLTDFYANQELQPPDKLTDEEKAAWLRAYVLEPFVDSLILKVVAQAKQNKAYDVAQAAVVVETEQLAVKVEQAQQDKLEALPESIRPTLDEAVVGAAEIDTGGLQGIAAE
jgi:hypothetical protein